MLMLGFALLLLQATAQDRNITGKVTGPDGNPIVGATITVKGTKVATATDTEGAFTLKVGASARSLVISYVGMVDQELNLAGRSEFNISMVAQSANLEEVVVVAYGTTKKETFTGSAAKISAKAIENRPLTNVSAALIGAAPGIATTTACRQEK